MRRTSSRRDQHLGRRRILQLAALGSGAFLAGCGSDEDGADRPQNSDDPGDGEDEETDTRDGDGGTETERSGGVDPVEFTPSELIRMEAGGRGFGGVGDQGHYYYEEVSGDFDVSVHCLGLGASDPSQQTRGETAGIMVRDSLDPQAPMALVRRRPHEDSVIAPSSAWGTWRPEHGEESEGVDGPAAEWLRMRREGDEITIYGSMTSEDWTALETLTVPDDVALGEDVVLGLAATGEEGRGADTAIATFADLDGVSPTDNLDLASPANAGRVEVREDVPYVTTLTPELDGQELTMRGSLYRPEELDAADCHFQYRRYDQDEWTTTEPRTLDASGSFYEPVPVSGRRIYLIRALVDVPDAPDLPVAKTSTGAVVVNSTPSPADEGEYEDPATPLSADASQFGLDAGFAEPAPWLDDDTPVLTITDLTYEELYEAFRARGERLIVFETGGIVDLQGEELSIRTDNCYVAGQTAPSPGVTFVNGSLQIAADDCVLQHVRCRPGDYRREGGWAPTSIHVQDERENNVVDHCTATWGIDENLTVGGNTRNTTYTNNLVAEALRDSTHPEDVHSMGSLINPEAENVALIGNVWAHNENRNPRLRLGSTSVVVNNLTYNFNDGCWMDPQARASVVGNQYLRARDTEPLVVSKSLDYGEGIPKAYLEDNYTDSDVPMHSDHGFERLADKPLWPAGLEAIPADDVYDHNLASAGARPADRTDHDERVLATIEDRDGDLIDSQAEVGGYPDLAETSHELEVPETGTRSWLREWSERVEAGD